MTNFNHKDDANAYIGVDYGRDDHFADAMQYAFMNIPPKPPKKRNYWLLKILVVFALIAIFAFAVWSILA
jgi:hypothetical protein